MPYSHELAATGGRGPYVWAARIEPAEGSHPLDGRAAHGTVLSTKVSPGINPLTVQVTSTYNGHTQKFVRTLNLTVKAKRARYSTSNSSMMSTVATGKLPAATRRS